MQHPEKPDSQLLSEWLKHRHDRAFQTLMSRYAGLVYQSARRVSGNDSVASEAAQLTFILLARKAGSLADRPSLAGWLHQTALLQTRDLLRKARRENRKLEQFHSSMTMNDAANEPSWQALAPEIDAALAGLNAKDREVLLLRFYRSMSVKEVAAFLGLATDAAQKRIDRATQRLKGMLARRGVATGSALAATLLAGFASDARAAVPAFGEIATKVLATTKGSAGAALLTTSGTKSIAFALPAATLLAGGIWIAAQFQSIAELERANQTLSDRMIALKSNTPSSQRSVSTRTALDQWPVNWAEVARQLRSGNAVGSMTGGFSFLDTNQRLLNRFQGASRDELIRCLDDLDAADVSEEDHELVSSHLTRSLSKIDPGIVVERMFPKLKPGAYEKSDLPSLIGKWVQKEPDRAVAWLDSKVAAGVIPPASKVFEVAVVAGLMPYDVEAAASRLASLPADQRDLLWAFEFGQAWTSREMAVWKDKDLAAAFARLARALPEKSHLNSLCFLLTEVGETDRNGVVQEIQSSLTKIKNGGPGKAAAAAMKDLFERIDATPAERTACVDAVISRGRITREELFAEFPDALR